MPLSHTIGHWSALEVCLGDSWCHCLPCQCYSVEECFGDHDYGFESQPEQHCPCDDASDAIQHHVQCTRQALANHWGFLYSQRIGCHSEGGAAFAEANGSSWEWQARWTSDLHSRCRWKGLRMGASSGDWSSDFSEGQRYDWLQWGEPAGGYSARRTDSCQKQIGFHVLGLWREVGTSRIFGATHYFLFCPLRWIEPT